MSIGEQIQNARKAKGMTQEALAQAVNVTRQSISNYESGKRLPDVETLMLLSKVLEYNFMGSSDESSAENGAESSSESTNAGEKLADGQSSVIAEKVDDEPEVVHSPEKVSTHSYIANGGANSRAIRKWIIPAVAVLAVAVVLLIWQPWKGTDAYPADDGNTYTKAEFQQTTENDAAKAYLRLVPSVERTEGSTYDYWLYTLSVYEQNGIAISIDRVEEFIFGAKTVVHRTYGATDMESAGLSVKIPANGEWLFSGGFPVQQVSGVGLKVTGTDENGAAGTFTCFLPLAEK